MALKAIVPADSFEDEVQEELRGHYKQAGDQWVLGIDGIDDHPSVKGLKTSQDKWKRDVTKLKSQVTDLEGKLQGFGDLTPEAVEELKAKAEQGGSKLTPAEIDRLVADKFGVTQQRLEKKIEGLERQVAEKDTAVKTVTGKLHEITVDTAIQAEAAKMNVRAKALPMVTRMARDVWRLDENGELVAMKGDQVQNGAHGPLTPQEWIESLQTEHDYLFEPNKGGGAEGDGGRRGGDGGRSAGKVLDMSKPNAIGENLDAIISGKVTDFRN